MDIDDRGKDYNRVCCITLQYYTYRFFQNPISYSCSGTGIPTRTTLPTRRLNLRLEYLEISIQNN